MMLSFSSLFIFVEHMPVLYIRLWLNRSASKHCAELQLFSMSLNLTIASSNKYLPIYLNIISYHVNHNPHSLKLTFILTKIKIIFQYLVKSFKTLNVESVFSSKDLLGLMGNYKK